MVDRTVQVTIVNGTDYSLTLATSGLQQGTWNGGPVPTVNSNSIRCVAAADSKGIDGAVSGSLVYNFSGAGAPSGPINLGFTNPVGGDNAFSCAAPQGMYICPFVQDGGYTADFAPVVFALCKTNTNPFPTTVPQNPLPNKNCQVTIVNGTKYTLTLDPKKTDLRDGSWNGGPVDTVDPYSIRVVANNTSGQPNCGASLTYICNSGNINLRWDIPLSGDNKFPCTAPNDIYICPFVQNGGYGTSNAAVTYVLCPIPVGNWGP